MGRPSSDTREIAVTSVKIERRKLDRLRKIASREHRTLSQEVRWLIDRRLSESEVEAEAA